MKKLTNKLVKGLTNTKEIVEIVEKVIPTNKEPIWTDSAKTILKGILVYCVKTDQKSLAQVKKMLQLDPKVLIKKLEKYEETGKAICYLSASKDQSKMYLINLLSIINQK